MSQMGQTRSFGDVCSMSALPESGRRAADLNPLDAAALEGYAETRFIKHAQPIVRRWPLRLRWLA
jgi:hypothetical protein